VEPRVGLFVTCLVDLLRPSVGFAAVRLIEAAGCRVDVVKGQTCCGQPAYNSGDRESAREIALATVRAFRGYDYVVAPSGSCAAMLKLHYPRLVTGSTEYADEVRAFAERVHELTSFLVNVRGMTSVPGALKARVAYHDACSGLRELEIAAEPRRLLGSVEGLELVEMGEGEICCGFGGLFSVKYPEISNAMVEKKAAAISQAGPDIVLGGDLGCLANIAGKLKRAGSRIACRHVAEVLAGALSDPPIAYPGSP
jgi:L-lactate dehydrogenase complex protein LldE